MPTAGDITEITFKHPDIGTVTVYPKGDEDATHDAGGYRSADDASMIDSGGRMIDKMNRVRPSLEVTVTWDMNDSEELEKMVQLASSTVKSDITWSHISGAVYGMKGKPVGDLQGNMNQATFTLKIAGSGTVEKVSG